MTYIYTKNKEAKEFLLKKKCFAILQQEKIDDGKTWIFEFPSPCSFSMTEIQDIDCFVSDKFIMNF